MRKEENEIDLLELMAKIYKLLKRNKYIILVFVIIGLIVGIYKSIGSEAYYKTNMLAKSPLSNTEIIEQLQSLSELQNNNEPLSEELNITLEETKKIKFLEVGKTEEESHLIQIKLEVFNNNLIPKIKEGIIQYLETNPYIKRELKRRQEHYQEYLEKINEALEILREKENTKNLPQAAKEILVSGESESYSDQIIKLMNKKGSIEQTLLRNQPLIIVKDFHKPENPQKDIKFQIILYTIIGFILGIIVVFFITLLRKLENYKKQ